MTRMPSTIVAALVAVTALVVAGCSDDKAQTAAPATSTGVTNATVSKTIEVAFSGAVDDPDDRLFAVTYFYSAQLGPQELGDALTAMFVKGTGSAPESLVMGVAGICGPDGYADKVKVATGFPVGPVTAKACTDDRSPFSVVLEIPRGATLHYSVDTGLVSDLENTETFAGNQVGSPNDPPTAEDFEVVKADDTTSFTYRFDAKN